MNQDGLRVTSSFRRSAGGRHLGKASITAAIATLTALAGHAVAAPSSSLIEAAKKEGQLTTIALPHDWCGYGAVIAGFKAKYGIQINELNPDAGSGDEVEAIKANKGNTGPQAPDVIDVGLSFGPTAALQGVDLELDS
jgi:putative spermidine/putrescine transport system substrate-binding protein